MRSGKLTRMGTTLRDYFSVVQSRALKLLCDSSRPALLHSTKEGKLPPPLLTVSGTKAYYRVFDQKSPLRVS